VAEFRLKAWSVAGAIRRSASDSAFDDERLHCVEDGPFLANPRAWISGPTMTRPVWA
jgi:hypothetical protein